MFIVLAAIVAASCATPPRAILPSTLARPQVLSVRVRVREGQKFVVREVPLEEYVAGTVLSEVDPPQADQRALERMFEVQAIIARTYALANSGRHGREGYDLCASTHCQLYDPARLRGSKWTGLVRTAVARTAGRILWFGPTPARAVFHADCGGHTSDAADVWGGEPLHYLSAVKDGGAADHAHAGWQFSISPAALRDALNADSRTRVGARLEGLEILQRDSGGRAESVTIKGTHAITVRGEVFRDALTAAFGAKSLKSTLFTVQRSHDRFTFTGRGFGHGVGLCQVGAFARLKAGATPESVLATYYPGTQLR